MLKYPKLFRREYLSHSTLWQAYLSGRLPTPSILKLNSKLFSAYSILEMISKSSAANSQEARNIYSQFIAYYEMTIGREGRNCEAVSSPLRRTKSFMVIYMSSFQDAKIYVTKLHEMYAKRYKE
jgi:hypothetical protein